LLACMDVEEHAAGGPSTQLGLRLALALWWVGARTSGCACVPGVEGGTMADVCTWQRGVVLCMCSPIPHHHYNNHRSLSRPATTAAVAGARIGGASNLAATTAAATGKAFWTGTHTQVASYYPCARLCCSTTHPIPIRFVPIPPTNPSVFSSLPSLPPSLLS
jgi:hypothetical protein